MKLNKWSAIALFAGGVVCAGAVMRMGGSSTCTYPDGDVVAGRCMFDDEFDALNTDVWVASDDWSGPLQNVIPDVGCFRHENVTVSGGSVNLTASVNARASCPQTWDVTPYYTAHFGSSWTPGATRYDVAELSMKTFRFRYGLVQMRMIFPPGRGPGGDVTLWGTNCQSLTGAITAVNDLYTKAEGDRICHWPYADSREMDIMQSSRTGDTTTINTSVYTDNSVGSPHLVDTFFGVPYYGDRYIQPSVGGFKNFLGSYTVASPTLTYHVYELDWRPGSWTVSVDGSIVAKEVQGTPAWVPDEAMFIMIWNAMTVAVTDADLPSIMLVDYLRITCPSGVPCEWSN